MVGVRGLRGHEPDDHAAQEDRPRHALERTPLGGGQRELGLRRQHDARVLRRRLQAIRHVPAGLRPGPSVPDCDRPQLRRRPLDRRRHARRGSHGRRPRPALLHGRRLLGSQRLGDRFHRTGMVHRLAEGAARGRPDHPPHGRDGPIRPPQARGARRGRVGPVARRGAGHESGVPVPAEHAARRARRRRVARHLQPPRRPGPHGQHRPDDQRAAGDDPDRGRPDGPHAHLPCVRAVHGAPRRRPLAADIRGRAATLRVSRSVHSRGERLRVTRQGGPDSHHAHQSRPEPRPDRERGDHRCARVTRVRARADRGRAERAQHVRPAHRGPAGAVQRCPRLGRQDHRGAATQVHRSGRAAMSQPCSRRAFLSAALAAPVAPALAADIWKTWRTGNPDDTLVSSPNGTIEFRLLPGNDLPPRLHFDITFRSRGVIEASPLSMVVDGVDLGQGVAVGKVERDDANPRDPSPGVDSEAVNRFKGARIALRDMGSGTDYVLDVRAFDDGVGFRCIVPGSGSRVPDEGTTFVLPAGSTAWYHDLRGHYEGVHTRKDIAQVQTGEWAAPPLTFKLADQAGYASITEAAVIDYSGMALQADGQRGFQTRLGHAQPPSYPFTLRYGDAEAARLAQPAASVGTITTPSRVVMIGPDLDTLVNCDIVHDLAPPPDARLFPQGIDTPWIRPGRAVWKYLDGGGPNTLDTVKEFSRLAGELGFENKLVEGFWRQWNENDLRYLID